MPFLNYTLSRILFLKEFIMNKKVLADMLAVSDKVAFKNTLKDNFSNIYTSSDVTAEEVAARIHSFAI